MPQARKSLVSTEVTPYYHVVSRCVRRHFLCGVDPYTGKDYSARKEEIRNRLALLAEVFVFAVDVCAYAILSNHYHLVLQIDEQAAVEWTDLEVAQRWLRLFTGPALVRAFVAGHKLSETQQNVVHNHLQDYRKRLCSLSWFMKCLNEPIARQANAEDNTTGHFWQARFSSQALLDEASVIAAMAYVDLNPIRAGMAETPEESDYTSIQQRVLEQDPGINAKDEPSIQSLPEGLRSAIGRLMPFSDQAPNDPVRAIPYESKDYLELVDWSGRAIIEGKRGSIPDNLPPILERLKIDPENYVRFINRTQKSRFHGFIGTVKSMRSLAQDFGRSFLKGQAAAAALFSPG